MYTTGGGGRGVVRGVYCAELIFKGRAKRGKKEKKEREKEEKNPRRACEHGREAMIAAVSIGPERRTDAGCERKKRAERVKNRFRRERFSFLFSPRCAAMMRGGGKMADPESLDKTKSHKINASSGPLSM